MDIPPLFKQGASARVRAGFFALIAVAMLIVDSRMHSLIAIRQAVGSALYPFQTLALMPRDAAQEMVGYFSSLSSLQQENQNLRRQQITNAQALQQWRLLSAENGQLRNLLNMQKRLTVRSLVGEILYDARDPFSRKIILNRGSRDGVETGQPVIDDIGVVGQVTRIFPFSAEVTLLTDKDQAIPVQVLRNGLRSIAYGRGQAGSLDLRFMAANADVRNGDLLVTSGIDGLYPAGLAVATVSQVEVKSSDAFARILCTPAAGIDRHRQLLILLAPQNLLPRAGADDVAEANVKAFPRRLREAVPAIAPLPTAAATSVTPATGTATAAIPGTANAPMPASPKPSPTPTTAVAPVSAAPAPAAVTPAPSGAAPR